jgi:hypothetical protein
VSHRIFSMAVASVAALGACASTPEADPLLRSDPHVAQLFNVLRATRAAGEPVDMAKLDAQLRDMGRAHAIEWEIEQRAAEAMILRTGHKAWASAQRNPEILASLEAFNRAIGAW